MHPGARGNMKPELAGKFLYSWHLCTAPPSEVFSQAPGEGPKATFGGISSSREVELDVEKRKTVTNWKSRTTLCLSFIISDSEDLQIMAPVPHPPPKSHVTFSFGQLLNKTTRGKASEKYSSLCNIAHLSRQFLLQCLCILSTFPGSL